jgi:hypothetical protein
MVARMRKLFLAIALIIVASVGSSGRPAAQIMFHPGGRHDVHLTLHNTSDACVWVTVYDERPVELGTAVLEPGRSWFRELVSSGDVKVRAQFWAPKNGCHGSFIQDRYDYIMGQTALATLTISGAAHSGRDSYIMKR